MVSVIIPARNETYLQATINDILAKARGEIEIIAVCDGYWPEPPIQDDKRVILIHHTKAVGQRRAINEAARIAKGKYILKTDAHSMFDEGFDVKLAADCGPDWTVIPRMYNLNIETWQPKWWKMTDYMWIRSFSCEDKPFRHNYFSDGRSFQRKFREHWKRFKEWSKDRPEIDDVMTGQGACWFMHTDRFWELGGMDEAHGQWGQMGVEIACKSWLSGGRQVVNKKTWFSHWFRGGSGPGAPWPMNNKKQHKSRQYSIDLWTNNRWILQTKPLSWLIEKFGDIIPTWTPEDLKKVSRMNGQMKDERDPKPWSQEYARNQVKGNIKEVAAATIKTKREDGDFWFVKAHTFKVKTLFNERLRFARPERIDGIRWQEECVPPFVKRILADEEFDDDKLKTLDYYDYLVSRLNPAVHPPEGPNRKGVRHVLNLMKDMIKLAHSMREDGLRAPLDFFIRGDVENGRDRVILVRGGRRLVIAYYLGWKKILARVWRTEHISKRFIPTNKWPNQDNSITKIAADQFAKYGKRATDKYWKHGYTYLYDNELAVHKTANPIKILELGINRGASLKVWKDSFPNVTVYGIDKDLKRMRGEFKDDEIQVFEGDATDVKFLEKIAKRHGPFTIIIDDCSHQPDQQRISFETLWPHISSQINRGGVYVIEDLSHNYEDGNNTIFPILTSKVDDIYKTNEVKKVSFYPNICFLTKA